LGFWKMGCVCDEGAPPQAQVLLKQTKDAGLRRRLLHKQGPHPVTLNFGVIPGYQHSI
jgi:hypothetical protein